MQATFPGADCNAVDGTYAEMQSNKGVPTSDVVDINSLIGCTAHPSESTIPRNDCYQ